MSLLIKALQKAEQSKDAKATDKPATKAGLELELAPQEPKPEPKITKPEEPPVTPATSSAEAVVIEAQEPANPSSPPLTAPETLQKTEPLLEEDFGFSLADEAGFSEPEPVKTEAPKPDFGKNEPPKAAKVTKPVEKPLPKKQEQVDPGTAKTTSQSSQQQAAAASMLSLPSDDRKKTVNTNRRSVWLGGVALVLLLVMGGGFYYYLQTLDQPQLVAMQPMPTPTPQPQVNNPAPPPATPPVPSQPEAAAITPVEEKAAVEQEKTTVASSKAEDKAPAENVAAIFNDTPAEPKHTVGKASNTFRQVPATDKTPLNVARLRKTEPATNATQMAAYQAFTNGDDNTANTLYKQLLQADPRNVDTLLGLAAVAARQERLDDAAGYYQKALEVEPKNSIAQAGLIALLGQANPTAAVSRLKSLITQQPEAAYLHAALGGVYADQNLWPNAQQSYFQAFSLDSTNADYAFNLAVSLDQMNKPELALDYYQRTLNLLPKQSSTIDKSTLESRIGQLRAALGK